MIRFFFTLFLSLALAAGSNGTVRADGGFVMPADLDAVDVYLLTHDVGNEIYTKWGHVTLRVHDTSPAVPRSF